MSDNESEVNFIYVFRCNDGPLYALTSDSTGQLLPLHIYPRISWRREWCVTLQRYKNSAHKKIIAAALNSITKRGFYLTHVGSELFNFFHHKRGSKCETSPSFPEFPSERRAAASPDGYRLRKPADED